jgi:hypothetical protein
MKIGRDAIEKTKTKIILGNGVVIDSAIIAAAPLMNPLIFRGTRKSLNLRFRGRSDGESADLGERCAARRNDLILFMNF